MATCLNFVLILAISYNICELDILKWNQSTIIIKLLIETYKEYFLPFSGKIVFYFFQIYLNLKVHRQQHQ